MKTLFAGAAALTLLLAIGWTFFPAAMLSWWSVRGDEITVYVARRYGCLLFGYTVILWLGRSAPPSPARTAILAGGAVVTIAMTALSLFGALSGVVGAAVWSAVAIEALLAVAFTYYWATER